MRRGSSKDFWTVVLKPPLSVRPSEETEGGASRLGIL